jgi:uncharacterized protein (DUF2062 family)
MPDPRLEDTKREEAIGADVATPGRWTRLTQWLAAHHMTLMTLPDTPHSIALGAAIGMFFGCTPLLGMKTLLSICVAWLFRSNKIAAVISVTLHDLILPFSPALYLWEYKLGMWALHGRLPQRAGYRHIALGEFMQWTTFFTVGQPILVGTLFIALPAALLVYFALRAVLIRARARRIEK